MKKNLKITVYGRVQGVLFRQTALEQAQKLGLFGYAQREEQGSISIEVDGHEEHLHLFLRWCQKGPMLAKVEMVIFAYSRELGNFEIFEIRENEMAGAYRPRRWDRLNA